MPSSRRNALGILLWGALATVAAPALYVIARFLKPPKSAPSTATAGPAGELGADAARIVKVGTTDAIVMRDTHGELYAMSLRCTHAGCNVRWRPEIAGFDCPCHGGLFDREGNVVKGPPKRPLERLEVRMEGELVMVSDMPA